MSDSLCLREAKEGEILSLSLWTREFLPHSASVHGMLNCGFRYGTVDLERVKIFIPNQEFPLFVIIIHGEEKQEADNYQPVIFLFWDVEGITNEEARRLMSSLPNFNWTNPFFVMACNVSVAKELDKIILGDNGLSTGSHKKVTSIASTYWFPDYIPRVNCYGMCDKALRNLSEIHACLVHKNWFYNYQYGPNEIKQMIATLPSAAIYDVENPSNLMNTYGAGDPQIATPISWAVAKHDGQIGFTYTHPDYRRRGLATIVTMSVARKLRKMEVEPIIFIDDSNSVSIRVHEKMGMKPNGKVHYIFYS